MTDVMLTAAKPVAFLTEVSSFPFLLSLSPPFLRSASSALPEALPLDQI